MKQQERYGPMKKRVYLFSEWMLLFCLLPLVLYLFRHEISHKVVPIVMAFAIVCSLSLFVDKRFDPKRFIDTAGITTQLKGIAAIFIVPALFMGVLTYLYLPHRFLAFPEEKPVMWATLLFLYPLLAAYPQEIIFRGFFFHRYQPLFPNQGAMVVVNAVCFGLAHVIYGNWVAPLLSTFGGVLFAYRYLKSGSLLAAGIEHGLWGNFLFTIGIGWYFYSGAIQ